MPLTPGTTLGSYSVTAKIGEGGMGEVYRARDTKLDVGRVKGRQRAMIANVRRLLHVVIAMWGVLLCHAEALPQVGGNLAAGPPLDLTLKTTTGPDGPVLSDNELRLITGEYYRLNVTSDSELDWRLDVDELLRNSHLRIVTINGIEVHLQGLSFRAIEFDVPGTAQFSFTPIRAGTFRFSVGDVPSTVRRRSDEAGRPVAPRTVAGQFVVE